MIKVRIQLGQGSAGEVTRNMLKNDGVGAFYKLSWANRASVRFDSLIELITMLLLRLRPLRQRNTVCGQMLVFCSQMKFLNLLMADVAALCVQYESDFRPNMSIVVKTLQPLLNAARTTPGSNALSS